MKIKKMVFFLTLFFTAVSISGCKKNVGTPEDNAVVEEQPEDENETESGYLYGFSCGNLSDPFYEALEESISDSLEKQGDSIIVKDAQSNPDLQNSQIQELIDAGADIVFVCPEDADKISSGLEALHDADIPVVNLESQVSNDKLTDAFIGSDNYNAGKVCGEDLVKQMPQGGNIVIIEDSGNSLINERITGFEEALYNKGFAVAERIDGNGTKEQIEAEFKEVLDKKPQINAVMCGDDTMALEVLDILKQYNDTDILVYCVGGSPEVKKALSDASCPLTGIGALSPINVGKSGVSIASKILNDKSYDKETKVETFLINRENINMYGTDGWQ